MTDLLDAYSIRGVSLGEAEPQEIEAALSDTILVDFVARLGRPGLEYHAPSRPSASTQS